MGLDNGVCIRRSDGGKIVLPSFVKCFCENYENEVEIVYWRKCWGIRNEIIKNLGGENDTGSYILGLDDLENIINILRKFLDKKYWDLWADSIWKYEDFIENSAQYLINLTWLYGYAKHNDVTIEFYDSY